jgi:hypothetical protein
MNELFIFVASEKKVNGGKSQDILVPEYEVCRSYPLTRK